MRCGLAVAAAVALLAIGGVALVLSASLRKPHQVAGESQHQIAIEDGQFVGASVDEEDVDHALLSGLGRRNLTSLRTGVKSRQKRGHRMMV